MALSTKAAHKQGTAAHRKDLNAGTPSLQHRHFAFIARVIKESYPYGIGDYEDAQFKACMASRFAFALKATNPNFDRARFMAACGVEE